MGKLNLGSTYSGHDVVSAMRNEYVDIVGVDDIIDKVLYRLMIRDYGMSQEAKYGVSFDMFKYASLNEKGNFAKMVRKEIGRTLGIVRSTMRKKAGAELPNDPRKARQAVKMARWRKSLGGSVSLYNNTKKTNYRAAIPPTKSGRPRKLSKRTQQIMSYWGADRAFILRFIDLGTTARYTGKGGGATMNRGSIAPRGFFRDAQGVMQSAMGQMGQRLEKLIEEVIG